LTIADDSFAEKNGKVTFVGKSTTATAKLAIKDKTLKMEFKKIGSLSSTGIKMNLEFGGCKIVAHL